MSVSNKISEKAVILGLSTRVARSRKCPRCDKVVGTWVSFGHLTLARHKNPQGQWCRRPPEGDPTPT
jgi:hypothetical protein